jgi:hypothetical protein
MGAAGQPRRVVGREADRENPAFWKDDERQLLSKAHAMVRFHQSVLFFAGPFGSTVASQIEV